MKTITHSALALAALAALAGLASAKPSVALDAAGMARLEAYRRAPDAAGELIYRGAVFEQHRAGASALYSYERRVGQRAQGQAAAHITHAPNGDVVIVEEAQFGPGYALQRFDATNRQQGYSGSVVLSNDGHHLAYRLALDGEVTTATEVVSDPVVSGPSLHGFILHHWDALAQGRSLPVRMIVMAKKQTYGFDIRRADAKAGRTSFSITPSNWLVRLAVEPLTVAFDSATRNVVRYEGRVPPMQLVDGKLKALDARVDYEMAVATYR